MGAAVDLAAWKEGALLHCHHHQRWIRWGICSTAMVCSGGCLIHRGSPLSLKVHRGKLPEAVATSAETALTCTDWGACPCALPAQPPKPLRAEGWQGLSLNPNTICRFPNPRAYPQMAETPVFGLFCALHCTAMDPRVFHSIAHPRPSGYKGDARIRPPGLLRRKAYRGRYRHLLVTPIDWKPSNTRRLGFGVAQSPLVGYAY